MRQADKHRWLGAATLGRAARIVCSLFFVVQVLLPPLHGIQAASFDGSAAGHPSGVARADGGPAASVGWDHAEAGGHEEATCAVCKILRQASFPAAGGAAGRFQAAIRDAAATVDRSFLCLAGLARPGSRAPPARV